MIDATSQQIPRARWLWTDGIPRDNPIDQSLDKNTRRI